MNSFTSPKDLLNIIESRERAKRAINKILTILLDENLKEEGINDIKIIVLAHVNYLNNIKDNSVIRLKDLKITSKAPLYILSNVYEEIKNDSDDLNKKIIKLSEFLNSKKSFQEVIHYTGILLAREILEEDIRTALILYNNVNRD